jgi:hypothetical protein
MKPDIRSTPEGVAFWVKVSAGGSRDALDGLMTDGTIKVRVSAAREKGRANKAVIRLLAGRLGVAPSRVSILQGAAATRKRILASGLSPDHVADKLSAQSIEQ